jgi:hypothetical protein
LSRNGGSERKALKPKAQNVVPIGWNIVRRKGRDREHLVCEGGDGRNRRVVVSAEDCAICLRQEIVGFGGNLIEGTACVEADTRKEIPSSLRRGRICPDVPCTTEKARVDSSAELFRAASEASLPKRRAQYIVKRGRDVRVGNFLVAKEG